MRTKTTINGPNINTVQKKKDAGLDSPLNPCRKGLLLPYTMMWAQNVKWRSLALWKNLGLKLKKGLKLLRELRNKVYSLLHIWDRQRLLSNPIGSNKSPKLELSGA